MSPLLKSYDLDGKEIYLKNIRANFEKLYPPAWSAHTGNDENGDDENGDDTDLTKHIDGAKKIINWLTYDILPNIRKDAKNNRSARYDIMAVTVDAVNRYLDLRLMLIITEDILEDSDIIQVANTNEIYNTIKLLTEFQQTLQKLYCPVYFVIKAPEGTDSNSNSMSSMKGGTRISTNIRYTTTQFSQEGIDREVEEARKDIAMDILTRGSDVRDSEAYPPVPFDEEEDDDDDEKGIPIVSGASSGVDIFVNSAGIPAYRFRCEIFESINYLCERYVEGSHSISNPNRVVTSGTGELLIKHCDTVWEQCLSKPTEFVHRHQDGTFYSETPTLIWQGLHNHLQLAILTGNTLL